MASQRAKDPTGDTEDELASRARSAEAAGEYHRALEHATRLRETFPDNPGGWFIAASVLRRLSRLDELDAILSTAPEVVFFDDGVISIWASVPRIRGDWPEALRRAEVMIGRYPNNSKSYCHAIYAINQVHGYSEALRQLEILMQRFPDNREIIGPAADIAMNREDWSRAASLWEKFSSLAPGDAGQCRCYIISLIRAGRLANADTVANAARRQFAADTDIAILWAEIPSKLGNWDVALARWTEFRAQWPEVPIGHERAAAVLTELGRSQDAAQLLAEYSSRFDNQRVTT